MVMNPAADARDERRREEIAPLKERCRINGVTHDIIAAALKCTQPYVTNVFAGRKNATLKFIDTTVGLCEQAERRMRRRKSA